MATDDARSRIDERVVAAGTTVRFGLLVVLLLVTSGVMVLYVAIALSSYDGYGCSLAAGVAPGDPPSSVIARRWLQWEAYYACTVRYAAPPPWWVLGAWFVLLSAAVGALFWALPAWKARRGRVVALEAVDRDGGIRRLMDDLAATAGLSRTPRIVVDPVPASTGAVVFGRNRKPVVRLHGGLLARRNTDPDGFRAVLLHEFAHIRNGDITITYLTVALWRVFLFGALPPFLVWCAASFALKSGSEEWFVEAPIVTRGLLLTAVLAVLVYLARSDVLRSREIYADLAAVRWGADPHGWAVAAPPVRGRLRRALGSFAELWQTHPRWDLRRDALNDPAVLFGVPAVPMFLTGVAASVINSNVWFSLTQYVLLSGWTQQGAALVVAALVAAVVGIAQWRAVTHAVLTSRRVPSGVRVGLWLGAGMVTGGLVTGQGTINEWLPSRPEVLLLVVLAAVVFTWWITQCALLWSSVWKRRTFGPVLLPTLAAACAALAVWFLWWQTQGVGLAAGWSPTGLSPGIAEARDALVSRLAGDDLGHSDELSVLDAVYTLTILALANVTATPLNLVAVAGLWAVPLLAWAIRPSGTAPRWAGDAVPGQPFGAALPPLRRVLLPGLLGGVLCWVGTGGVLAHLHSLYGPDADLVEYMSIYFAGPLAALVAGSTVAAAVAAATASRYRLLVALISGETAVLVGFAGTYVLRAAEGCIEPLSATSASCRWQPGVLPRLSGLFLTPALLITVLTSIAVAALVALIRRSPRPRSSAPVRGGVISRRLCTGLLCVVALGIGANSLMVLTPQNSRVLDPADVQRAVAQSGVGVADRPVPDRSRALQVQAWLLRGGDDLMDQFFHDRRELFDDVQRQVDSGRSAITEMRHLRPLCVSISGLPEAANHYFRVPDQQVQAVWETFVTQARDGGRGCLDGLDQQNADLFNSSMQVLATAQETSDFVDTWIDAIATTGGL
ncbi:M48 family metallopeptidase [Saccharopolyspora taberi]|uniref:Peptidase M48 domain-containing protein n=1 Tax=Saccharopolyspora taberi TaxID=60895 RepID=A0ABN3V329_9PSEU